MAGFGRFVLFFSPSDPSACSILLLIIDPCTWPSHFLISNLQQLNLLTTPQSRAMMTDEPPNKRKRHNDEPSLSDDQFLTSPSKSAGPSDDAPSKPLRLQNLLSISGSLQRVRSARDDIHGDILFEPALTALIDTPYFQRLRNVKQLGVTSSVFPNATHTRFEHSLGVAHLAQKQAESLMEKQPALGITKKDVLLVKMAGLCHDMGHGPYSHMFEGHLQSLGMGDVQHELMSLDQIDAVLKARGLAVDMDNLDKPLKQVGSGIKAKTFGLVRYLSQEQHDLPEEDAITSRDIVFVKECILGEPLAGQTDFIGRPLEKEFLYDIVNNRHSGKDVDKDDYYIRDSVRALGEGTMDMLLINSARVAKIECKVKNCFRCKAREATPMCLDGTENSLEQGLHLSLAYPKKYTTTVIKFFDRRQELHATIYTHKTAKSIEYMIRDILAAAEPHYRIKLGGGRTCSISEATQDPEAFRKLNDQIITQIEESDSLGLEEAKRIINRKDWRDLYKMVRETSCRLNEEKHGDIWGMTEDQIHAEMMDVVRQYKNDDGMDEDPSNLVMELEEDEEAIGRLKERDFIVEVRVIHKGKREENPVNYISFFDTHRDERELDNKAFNLPMASQVNEEEYATHDTKAYLNKTIRLFSRASKEDDDYDEKNKAIAECFKIWFEAKGCGDCAISMSQC